MATNYGQRWSGALGVLVVSAQICLGVLAYLQTYLESQAYLEAKQQLALVERNLEVQEHLLTLAPNKLYEDGEWRGKAVMSAMRSLDLLQLAGYDYQLKLEGGGRRENGNAPILASGGLPEGELITADVLLAGDRGQLVVWNYFRKFEPLWSAVLWGAGLLCLGLSLLAWFWVDRYLQAMAVLEAAQVKRQAALFSVVQEAVVILVEKNREWVVQEINPAAASLFGVRCDDVIASPWRSLFPLRAGLVDEGVAAALAECDSASEYAVSQGVGYWARADGDDEGVWLEYAVLPFPEGGRVVVLRDVSERRRREEGLNLYRTVFRGSGEAMLVTDRGNRILEVNPAFSRLTGYSQPEVEGLDPRVLASGQTSAETYREMWASLQSKGMWQGELWDRHRSGHVYPKWAVITAVHDDAGEVAHYVATFLDISERKAREERVSHQAYHDSLTGLPNRFRFNEYFAEVCCAASRGREVLTLMFLDLDGFKLINDLYGHAAGDALLVEVAARLRACVRESDFVARLGGDEFVIVLPGVGNRLGVERVAEKILSSLARNYLLSGINLASTPSIGIASYPQAGETPEALLLQADAAMYQAKRAGKGRFCVAEVAELAAGKQ